VARAIEDRIIELGWPVGRLIGSEQSLMAEHDASRGVLREAVRLLEHHGTARMRRGPGGGLVIQAPTPYAVRRASSLLLQYQQAGLTELMEARAALELSCLDVVAERIKDPEVSAHLIETLESEANPASRDSASFHHELAALSGNPALRLFTQTLLEIHGESVPRHRRPCDPEPALLDPDASHRAHQRIYEALVVGDLPLARKQLSAHLDEVTDATSAALLLAEEDFMADPEDVEDVPA
jgi:DNA-binding FadR family transcriptional regulator